MKKLKVLIISVFTAAYSIFLSVGGVCALHLFGNALAEAMFHDNIKYPRFIPFCFVTGLLCFVAIAVIIAFNVKFSEKLGYTRLVWWLQFISALVLVFFEMKAWEIFFEYLQKTF